MRAILNMVQSAYACVQADRTDEALLHLGILEARISALMPVPVTVQADAQNYGIAITPYPAETVDSQRLNFAAWLKIAPQTCVLALMQGECSVKRILPRIKA